MSERRLRRRTFVVAVGASVALAGCADDDPDDDPADDEEEDPTDEEDDDEEYDIADQPDDAAATFVSPDDGDTVRSPVEIVAEAEGVELVAVDEPAVGEGHLHVLVDRECFEEGEIAPGPSDEAEAEGIYHWGDGSSEGEIDLEPGEYDLCLQLADGVHRVFGETDEITITVEDA